MLLLLAMSAGIRVHGGTATPQDNDAQKDSTVNVIAWFGSHDTVTYNIHHNEWRINGWDTIHSGAASMKVQLNIVDSTAVGYKLKYTILEYKTDTVAGTSSAIAALKDRITSDFGNRLTGKTVLFETDEYGTITKFNNLDEIKKDARSLFNDALKEISRHQISRMSKDAGFDITKFAKQIDTDKLVEDYLEELSILFSNHGLYYKMGETTEHVEATDKEYENTQYTSASIDMDNGLYHVTTGVVTTIPPSEMRTLLGDALKPAAKGDIAKTMNETFDDRMNIDTTVEDVAEITYLLNGWPYEATKQRSTTIGTQERVRQTLILLDYYSFGQQ